MKAASFEQFGSAQDVLIIGERPDPTPQAGEVLVRLASSGVNPSDTKKRLGSFPDLLDNGYVIPHSDGAGVIADVGPGGPKSRIGERVWVYNAQFGRRFGSAAEYVALDTRCAPRLPDGVGFDIGAVLGIPVMTAHRCVFADGDPKGETILITGGAGRVGHYAIQWAAQAGADVIATASNAADEAACLAAGARAVVNHRDPEWAKQVLSLTGGAKVPRVIDVEFGANLAQILDLIAVSGVIVTYSSSQDMTPTLPFYRMMFMDLSVRMVIVYAMPDAAKAHAIRDIDAALSARRLDHRIAATFPLDQCAAAHTAIETGAERGCVVVTMGDG